jgi:hypothetical protein
VTAPYAGLLGLRVLKAFLPMPGPKTVFRRTSRRSRESHKMRRKALRTSGSLPSGDHVSVVIALALGTRTTELV